MRSAIVLRVWHFVVVVVHCCFLSGDGCSCLLLLLLLPLLSLLLLTSIGSARLDSSLVVEHKLFA